jgi:hypothetical protein
MKKLYSLFLLLIPIFAWAGPGDTLHVQSHQDVHMSWHGNYDRWGQFPSAGQGPFYKVLMDYTLGCPSSGCSEWDYTTQIFLRRRTGTLDSNQVQNPYVKVGNTSPDSVGISWTPTFSTAWNSSTQSVDTTFNAPLQAILFQNPQQPAQATDTLNGWPAWGSYLVFDSVGGIIDTLNWSADTVVYQSYITTYSVFEVIENIEIGRLITPYAGTYPNTWKWTYRFDVTDFQHLLKDSVEIRAFYSGYQDGFTVTLNFRFVEGEPPLKVARLQKMFGGSFPYGNPSNPIGNYMAPLLHQAYPGATRTDALLYITGHGFGGNENCAEFCSKNYYLKVNSQSKASAAVWDNTCGWNPIFPQGGTWVYDRANWCPGSSVSWYRHNVTPFLLGQTNLIGFDMQAFTNVNNNYCSYITEGHLIDYLPPTYQNDASVEEVLAPSTNSNHSRFNPICGSPKIRIRNNGASALTAAKIEYGVSGGAVQVYNWTGNLALLAEAEVDLPPLNSWFNSFGANTFFARITEANGQADELAFNNEQQSAFQAVPQLPDSFFIFFKTNMLPAENNWLIEDANGQVVRSRSSFPTNTLARDTIRLNPGCYRFRFNDTGGDGIAFWANQPAGSGSLRFMDAVSPFPMLRNFGGDFGSGADFQFTVGYQMSTGILNEQRWNLYPNPAYDNIVVEFHTPLQGKYAFRVMDLLGRTLQEGSRSLSGENSLNLTLSNLPEGSYVLISTGPGGFKRSDRFVVGARP